MNASVVQKSCSACFPTNNSKVSIINVFPILYARSTLIREGLLNINIRYNIGASPLERKEGIIAGATVALVIYALTLSLLNPAMSAIQTSKTLSNSGSVRGIGVGIYQYSNCTSPVSSFNWGLLDPGASINKTVYIRNEGNSPATLSMAASNWNPSSASSYMALSWNYGGQTLSVNQVIQVKFTLSVSSSVSGITNFSFDITVTASG
jgi:hypothetical protein